MTPARTTRRRILAVVSSTAVVGALGMSQAFAATTGQVTGRGGRCLDVATSGP